MTIVQTRTATARPVAEVFAILSNPENNPKWSSGSIEAKMTSIGPIGVGSTWRSVGRFLGRNIESELEATEFEENRKLVAKSKSGPVPFQASMTFEPADGGTRVNATFEAEPGGFFKLAEPLVIKMAKRQFQGDLDNLKDLMEANAL